MSLQYKELGKVIEDERFATASWWRVHRRFQKGGAGSEIGASLASQPSAKRTGRGPFSSTRILIAALVAAASLTSCGGSATTTTVPEPVVPFRGELRNVLDEALDSENAMGFSLAVMMPGYEPWIAAAGESAPGVPITSATAFGVGSISKNYVAALVLQLAEEGKLSLDDQLHEWLPDYPNVDSTATIRQLLNHTSGTFQPNHHPDFWPAVFADGTREWTDDEILASFLEEPYSAKGTEWHYSNAGYTMLGQIVEEATGSSVSAELRERFLEPLDLTSVFFLSEEDAPGEVAEGWFDISPYSPEIDVDPEPEAFSDFPWTATMPEAGGVFASVEDLATWAQAVFHDQRVLEPDSLEQMLQFVTPEPDDERRALVAGYGLGAMRFNPDLFDGKLVIGHSGGALFYSAAALYLPDYGVVIGALQNFDDDETFGSTLNRVVSIVTAHTEATP